MVHIVAEMVKPRSMVQSQFSFSYFRLTKYYMSICNLDKPTMANNWILEQRKPNMLLAFPCLPEHFTF